MAFEDDGIKLFIIWAGVVEANRMATNSKKGSPETQGRKQIIRQDIQSGH